MVIGFYSCILIQWESSVDANSELLLFKEIYDETLDKNAYEIGFCDSICAFITHKIRIPRQ